VTDPDGAASARASTEALLRLCKGEGSGAGGGFDGADLSPAGLGPRAAGLSCWDPGRGGVRLTGLNLAGASLRRADLSGADLGGSDLSGASCGGVVLRGARLEQADLHGADLIGAVLTGLDAGEANFSDTLLEDADLSEARLRFADFTGAIMDGADLSRADLWGARLAGVTAERAMLRSTRLDEAKLGDADFSDANLTGASLRHADLKGARLRGACLREAGLDRADLADADLSGAILPHVSLTSCDLTHIRVAGAWMERTRMRASQLGGAIGEEVAGEFEAAREGYVVLEQNFRTLGLADDESWAFRRRRRMGKRLNAARAREAVDRRDFRGAVPCGLRWLGDVAAEQLCDYGESVMRVFRAFCVVLLLFALVYWLTGSLQRRETGQLGVHLPVIDYLLFSLDSMTTVGTGEVAMKPAGQVGVLLSSLQTVVGTVLLGLFGFVLGVRMRN